MGHTPEPWYKASTRQWTMQGVGADRDGNPCTILIGNHNFDDCDANEDRAIACVNACTGMADPAGEIARLRAIEKAARNGPCRHTADHTGDNCELCNALSAKEAE